VIALATGQSIPTVPTSYTYEPYGAQSVSGTASSNPFGFTAREADAANGLQFNRARYLSPTYGRFVSEDPIGIAGGSNLYRYVEDAPALFADPLGREGCVLHFYGGCIDFSELQELGLDVLAFTLAAGAFVAFVYGSPLVAPLFLAANIVSIENTLFSIGTDLLSGQNLAPDTINGVATNVSSFSSTDP
jgi:RHS repeat-associated protein